MLFPKITFSKYLHVTGHKEILQLNASNTRTKYLILWNLCHLYLFKLLYDIIVYDFSNTEIQTNNYDNHKESLREVILNKIHQGDGDYSHMELKCFSNISNLIILFFFHQHCLLIFAQLLNRNRFLGVCSFLFRQLHSIWSWKVAARNSVRNKIFMSQIMVIKFLNGSSNLR